MLGSARAHTDAVKHRGSTYAMRATPSSPSPRCRRLVAEPDSLKTLGATFAAPGSPRWMLHAAGCAESEQKSVGGSPWARHDTCSVRSYRAAGVLRNPRIYVVVQKRGRRGGHLPQSSIGGQLVIRTRPGGVGRRRRRGKTWPDSTVASLSAAASRSRRTRMSITPVDLELVVSKFALKTVPQDQHAARSM